jgi:hypothetical protein
VTGVLVQDVPDDEADRVLRFAYPPRENDPDVEADVPVECCAVWIDNDLVHNCCQHAPGHSAHRLEQSN